MLLWKLLIVAYDFEDEEPNSEPFMRIVDILPPWVSVPISIGHTSTIVNLPSHFSETSSATVAAPAWLPVLDQHHGMVLVRSYPSSQNFLDFHNLWRPSNKKNRVNSVFFNLGHCQSLADWVKDLRKSCFTYFVEIFSCHCSIKGILPLWSYPRKLEPKSWTKAAVIASRSRANFITADLLLLSLAASRIFFPGVHVSRWTSVALRRYTPTKSTTPNPYDLKITVIQLKHWNVESATSKIEDEHFRFEKSTTVLLVSNNVCCWLIYRLDNLSSCISRRFECIFTLRVCEICRNGNDTLVRWVLHGFLCQFPEVLQDFTRKLHRIQLFS